MKEMDARQRLKDDMADLWEVSEALPSLVHKSDVEMAIMYLRHCLRSLEEEVKVSTVKLIGSIEWDNEPWHFYTTEILYNEAAGLYYWATDSGCSCPMPFEDHVFPDDYQSGNKFALLEALKAKAASVNNHGLDPEEDPEEFEEAERLREFVDAQIVRLFERINHG